jgi:hypothetical protein
MVDLIDYVFSSCRGAYRKKAAFGVFSDRLHCLNCLKTNARQPHMLCFVIQPRKKRIRSKMTECQLMRFQRDVQFRKALCCTRYPSRTRRKLFEDFSHKDRAHQHTEKNHEDNTSDYYERRNNPNHSVHNISNCCGMSAQTDILMDCKQLAGRETHYGNYLGKN